MKLTSDIQRGDIQRALVAQTHQPHYSFKSSDGKI
jgi:hypothetical protein